MLKHMPYTAWRPLCVIGRGRAIQHRKGRNHTVRYFLLVATDFATSVR